MIVALLVPDMQSDEFAPADLFQKKMKQIHAAKMRKSIGVEFYLHFLSAISHTMKAYIMDGFVAMADDRQKALFITVFEPINSCFTQDLSKSITLRSVKHRERKPSWVFVYAKNKETQTQLNTTLKESQKFWESAGMNQPPYRKV